MTTDGRWALSISAEGVLKLWEVSSGRCVRSFGHEQNCRSARLATLSPDGRWVLSDGAGEANKWGQANMLTLWNSVTGQCVRTFKGHNGAVRSISVTPSFHRALSGSDDCTLRLWELPSGRCVRTFAGHKHPLTWVSLTDDAQWALSASEGGPGEEATLKLWDVSKCRCLRTFHLGEIPTQRKSWPWPVPTAVCFSAAERWVLSSRNGDPSLQLWEVFGNVDSVPAPFELCHPASSEVALSVEQQVAELMRQSEQTLACGDAPAATQYLRAARRLSGHSRKSELVSAWMELYVRLPRKTLVGSWLYATFDGHTDSVKSVSLNGDGSKAVSGGENGELRLWEIPSGRCPRIFEPDSGVNSVCLSADGRLVLSSDWGEQGPKLRDAVTGRCLRCFEEACAAERPLDPIAAMAWSDPYSAVALSSDNRWALFGTGHLGSERLGGQDYDVELWEVASGRRLRSFPHSEDVASVAFSADDRLALSGTWHQSSRGGCSILALWELSTGRCLRIFEGHKGHVNSVCLSTDGRLAFSGSDDATVKLWDAPSGRCERTFEGHGGAVNSVALTADGKWILSGSEDRTLKFWEVSNGRCIHTVQGHTGGVNSVSLTRDGRWALSGSTDRTLKLWALDWELEERVAADWDEAARAHLINFLTVHTPYAAQLPACGKPSEECVALALTRRGRPNWNEQDFRQLLDALSFAGYGFLRADGVQRQLEKMAACWQDPPQIAGLQSR